MSWAGAGISVFVDPAFPAAPGCANSPVAARRMDRRWCVAIV
jgi:hypothetical protein